MSLIWQTKKLGDLFRVGSSKRVVKSQWKKEGVPFYRGREITSLANNGYVDNELFISEELYSNYAKKYGVPNSGDIVITAIGTIGNSYVVKKKDKFYFKDASVLWLNKIADIDTEFVNLWFKSPSFKEQLEKGNGATVDTLTIKKLESLTISIPSIPEQKKIVKQLSEVFEKVTKAKEAAERNLQNSKELFVSYLQSVFANSGEDWEENNIGDLCNLMTGGTPSRSKKEYFENGSIRWLVSGDVNLKEIFDCDGRISELGMQNSNVKYLPINSVMIALNGQGKTRGMVAMLRVKATCNQSLVSIYPKDVNKILPEYVYHNLNIRYEEIRKITGDAGNDRRGLNMPLIRNIKINYPKSIKEQEKLVREFNYLSKETERLQKIYTQKLDDLEELKKSVLKMVFSGESTPIVSPVQVSPRIPLAVPSPYIRNQVHAAIVDQVLRDSGSTTEVAVAKYDHLLQELCGLPLGYQFATHQFGPFDNQIKRLVSSGLGRNKWFTKRSGMIVFGSNVSALLSRQSNLYHSAQASMKELSRLGITKLDADGVELLSTVCHSIKETGSVAIDSIRTFMSNWQTDNNARTKAEKFSEERTRKCLDFILKNNLHQKLLPTT